eukprot:8340119-Pyramimonas_sp.AAC.1
MRPTPRQMAPGASLAAPSSMPASCRLTYMCVSHSIPALRMISVDTLKPPHLVVACGVVQAHGTLGKINIAGDWWGCRWPDT